MITVVAKSRMNRFIRVFSALTIIAVGLLTAFVIDFQFLTGKPLIVTIACFVAFPIWLFSCFHTGYLLTEKQQLEVLEDRIKLSGKGINENIPLDRLDNISLEEVNKFIVLTINYQGLSRSYNLYYKWYLRDFKDQAFLKQNFEKFLSMVEHVEALEGKILIDSSMISSTDSAAA